MKKRSEVTVEEVRRLFHYDAVTGVLIRKETVGTTAKVGSIVGSKSLTGYLTVGINYKNYLVHRIIWLWVTGEWPKDLIDHINLIPSDNRLLNLREASSSQNLANTSIGKGNSSGFKGVSFDKARNRWEAYLSIKGKKKNLGRFNTPDEAHSAYRKAAQERSGKFARFS